MVGYVSAVSADGLSGTIAHGEVNSSNCFCFYGGVNFFGPPLHWQERVAFDAGQEPWWAANVASLGVYDMPAPQRLGPR